MAKKSKRTNKRKVSKRHYRKKNKKTRKIYKRKMMKGGSEAIIRKFMKYTKLNEEQAAIKLSEAGGDINLAKGMFLSEQEQGHLIEEPPEGVPPETGSRVVDPINKLIEMFPGMSRGQARFLLEEGGDIENAKILYQGDPTIGTGARASDFDAHSKGSGATRGATKATKATRGVDPKFTVLSYNVCSGTTTGGYKGSSTRVYDEKCKGKLSHIANNKCEENIWNIITGYPFTFVGIQEGYSEFPDRVVKYGNMHGRKLGFIKSKESKYDHASIIYDEKLFRFLGETASTKIGKKDVQTLSSHNARYKPTRSIPFACGIFLSKNTEKNIIVISLHGSHGGWSISRVTQYILKQIRGGVGIPVLLMGDFNIPGKKQFETKDHIFLNMDENYHKRPPQPAKKTAFNLTGETITDSVGWDRKYGSRPDNIYIGDPKSSKKITPLSHQVYRPSRDPSKRHPYIQSGPYIISSESSDHLPVTGSFSLV